MMQFILEPVPFYFDQVHIFFECLDKERRTTLG